MRTSTIQAMAVTAIALLCAAPAGAESGRAYLGVYLSELSDGTRRALGLSEGEGILIERVSRDGPAAEAGLQDGDVILSIDGREIDSSADVTRALARSEPKEEVTVAVWRGGKRLEMPVTLGRQRGFYYSYSPHDDVGHLEFLEASPAPEAPEVVWGGDEGFLPILGSRPQLGIRTQELNGQLAEYFQVTNGVLVTWVTRKGAAGKAGIQAGDVIVTLGGEPIHRERDLLLILQDLRGEDQAEVGVVRRGASKTISVVFDE